MLNQFRDKFNGFISSIASFLTRLGVKPWVASLTGLILAASAAIILIFSTEEGYVLLSCLLFLLGGFMDVLDGSLARMQNAVSGWGGFYDSFIDRLTEIIYVFGVAYSDLISMYLAYLYITTSLLISYSRARSEGIDVDVSGVGLMERAERIIILVLAIVIWIFIKFNLDILLIILIFLNIVTIIQRIIYIWRESGSSVSKYG